MLNTMDIFLFNEPRSTSHDLCNYSILGSIKDGSAVSLKYNNDVSCCIFEPYAKHKTVI